MTAKTLPSLLLLIVVASAPSFADPARSGHAGQEYSKRGAGWVQRDADGSEYRVDPRVITVKFRETVAPGAREALHRDLGGEALRRAATGFVDVRIGAGEDVFHAIDAYRASGLVEIAEPNTFGEYTVQPPEAVPNDTSYPSQTWLPLISAAAAWDLETGSPDVIVAVLDSGTEFSHSDLGTGADAYQNVWLNPGEDAWSSPNDPGTGNGIDDDLNGFADDWKGWDFANGDNVSSGSFFHGTAVAGAVAAKTHNALGVAGTAGGWNGPGARVMIAGVGDLGPVGAVIDDAILYAAAHGAHIVQLSLSVGASAAIDAAIQDAHDNFDMTIICASGNGSAPNVSYPSSNPNVIAVGATTTSDLKANFSNHGPLLEISAPGTNFLTLDLNNTYDTTSGTSFSAPTVSGIVALMLARNPSLTNTEIRQILHDTADEVGGYDYNWNAGMPGHSFELGYGRANAESALLAAGSGGIFSDGFESGNTSAWTVIVP